MNEFTWIPIYQELAKKLLEYEDRQAELVALVHGMSEAGFKVFSAHDRHPDGSRGRLKRIDPFTFFATFNRATKLENRQGIVRWVKERLSLSSDVPSDFNGIPVVNLQNSWFFSFAVKRGDGDIPTLWELAHAAVEATPETIDPALFRRGLAIRGVGPAKLTMGMFWFNPDVWLALDSQIRTRFERDGFIWPKKVESLDDYLRIYEHAKSYGVRFVELSHSAWESNKQDKKRYWAGGFGKPELLNEMLEKKMWWHNYPRTMEHTAGKQTWTNFEQIRVGDEFAIKGYGGRNDLQVHLLGTVKEVFDDGRVQLEPLDRPLFKGKAPRGARPNWLGTLAEVTSAQAIEEVFHAATSSAPAATHETVEVTEEAPEIDLPKNIILYGPPGTGKTYQMLQWAQEYFSDGDPAQPSSTVDETEIESLPLWQVLAVIMRDAEPMTVPELLEHPLIRIREQASAAKNYKAQLWVNLQTHTKQECENVSYARRRDPLIFWKDERSRWTVDTELLASVLPDLAELQANKDKAAAGRRERFTFVTFHQSYSYEDFVEGIRPQVGEDEQVTYEVIPGAFRRIVKKALDDSGRNYAIFIDELNRANISKVFGELITLLEEDKRLGADNAVAVRLPYSGEALSVPQNLWVIGSMNTADRSIALLDTALRRRFEFREFMPDSTIVEEHVGDQGTIDGVNVTALMNVINDRVEYLFDRDHTLGHSYFLGIETLDDLRDIFLQRVIPLLQEYFYEDWEKVALVLGAGNGNGPSIIERTAISAKAFFAANAGNHAEDQRYRFSISEEFKNASGDALRPFFDAISPNEHDA